MRVKLGDVCDCFSSNLVQKDIENLQGDYPIYGAAGYIRNVDFFHQDKDYVAVVKDGAGIGRTMFLPAQSSVIGTLQYLIPKDSILPEFLAFAVQSMHLERYYTGATIPHIYFKDYKKEEFDLPDIDVQREIVVVLKKVSNLIAQRKFQISNLDELIKAQFVEMFGDPVANTKGWTLAKLDECLSSIDSGKSFVCSNEARTGEGAAVLKLSAVTYGEYRPEENKVIFDNTLFIKNAEVHDGDLLFTRKNTPELVGMCAFVTHTPSKLMMPDLIFRLNTNECCNKLFLWKLINHPLFRKNIESMATGSAKSMSNISKERLKQLTIIVPPLKLQQQFATFVQQVDKSKVAIQKSLDEMQLLFDSLMQKYFG